MKAEKNSRGHIRSLFTHSMLPFLWFNWHQ